MKTECLSSSPLRKRNIASLYSMKSHEDEDNDDDDFIDSNSRSMKIITNNDCAEFTSSMNDSVGQSRAIITMEAYADLEPNHALSGSSFDPSHEGNCTALPLSSLVRDIEDTIYS